jgi:urease accessory protein
VSDWTGVLELDVEERQGKSFAKDVYFHGAFKLQRPIYHGNSGMPCYYILNPGGGYLDGDAYRMRVSLDEKAKLTLTTQAATKIYKTPQTRAYQETEIDLSKGSYLEYLPDPVIAYKNARYLQKNVVRMKKGATLLYSDILTPGWSPGGGLFNYDMLRLINEIYLENELVALDHLKLSPNNGDMNGLGFMEGYTHLGSFIVIGEKTNDDLIKRLYEMINEKPGDFSFGISQLVVSGFTVRVMANMTQVVQQIFGECHKIISEEWYQRKPSFLRKY